LSTVATRPEITPVDRFGLTVSLAIIIHAIILLGVTFTSEDKRQPRFDTMEIILVQQKDVVPPDDAKLLAQAAQQGGATIESEVTPASPLPPPFPEQVPEITAPPVTETQPPQPVTEPGVEPQVEVEPKPEIREQIAAKTATPEIANPKTVSKAVQKPEQDKKSRSAAELLINSFKIASLSAQIKQKLESRSTRPRRTFISASTKTYKYAAYMEAWRAKVERVGNLNYPDEARKRGLSGSLILDVALNPDGSVNQITIRRSSGHKILDDAAIRIVSLASPFAPFPDNIKVDTDILHITRTWQFLNNKGFQ